MTGDIKIVIPSSEHRAELEAKGIDIVEELTRVVYDYYVSLRDGKQMGSLTMSVTKEQVDTLEGYGVDAPGNLAAEFKKELKFIDLLPNG